MNTSLRKQIVTAVSVALVVFVCFFIQGFIKGFTKAREERASFSEEYLIKLANKINEGLPYMTDDGTRWDHVQAGPGKKLTFSYTLVKLTKSEINSDGLPAFLADVKAKTCAVGDTKEAMEKGVAIAFEYRDKEQRPIVKHSVVAADCS